MSSSFSYGNLAYANNWHKEHLHFCSVFLPFGSKVLCALEVYRTGHAPRELRC